MLRLIITTLIFSTPEDEDIFSKLYNLLDNSDLLIKTCNIIEESSNNKPSFFIENNLVIKEDFIIFDLYEEYLEIKVKFKNIREIPYKIYYKKFEWNLDKFNEETCNKMVYLISKRIKKLNVFTDMYIFINIFPNNIKLSVDDKIRKKEELFLKELEDILSPKEFSNIKVLDYLFYQYYKKGSKKCFFYEYACDEDILCYSIKHKDIFNNIDNMNKDNNNMHKDINNNMHKDNYNLDNIHKDNNNMHKDNNNLDNLDNLDNMHKDNNNNLDKDNIKYNDYNINNIFDDLLPITGSDKYFNKFTIEKISTDKKYTELFFNTILFSNIRFNNTTINFYCFLLSDMLNNLLLSNILLESSDFKYQLEVLNLPVNNIKEYIYDLIINYKINKEIKEEFDNKNNKEIKEEFDNKINKDFDKDKYNTLNDKFINILIYIYKNHKDLFILTVQDILKRDQIKCKLHFHLNMFLLDLQIILKNKISFYIFVYNKINKSDSPFNFISDYKKIGLRSYKYKSFEKDFQYILERSNKLERIKYEKYLPRTYNNSMIELLREE